MRVSFALTYYRPHLSGLTLVVQRWAEGLACQGHRVSVLTSRHDKRLALTETLNGVCITRVRITWQMGKGPLMAGYFAAAWREIRRSDAVVLTLPATPVEGLCVSLLARVLGRPLVVNYTCDVQPPPGFLYRLARPALLASFWLALAAAATVTVSTEDYALSSALVRRFRKKLEVIPLPIRIGRVEPVKASELRRRHASDGGPLIGFAGRLSSEKGVEYLLEALPEIRQRFPGVKLLHAGEVEGVVGEQNYRLAMLPRLRREGTGWASLGVVEPDLANFYAACDVVVLPSVNRTESFGMVQAESMLCGTPVVASDLPGVRAPVLMTGMGKLCRPRDAKSLAEAVVAVLGAGDTYRRPAPEIEKCFTERGSVCRVERLLAELTRTRKEDYLQAYLRRGPIFAALVRGVLCRLISGQAPLVAPVLDLGCGDGLFAALALPGCAGVGLDSDCGALREAKANGAHHALVRASGVRLPFADHSLGTVVANSVLEHIPEMDRALAEAYRVLKPGGRFLATAPSHRFGDMLMGSRLLRALGGRRLAGAYGRWFNRHSLHYHAHSLSGWRERLRSRGFRVEHAQYYLSARAHRAFDLAHYISVPRWLCYRVTGRWTLSVLVPLTNVIWEHWLGPHYRDSNSAREGPYVFLAARKP